jgi:hypothetical protein
MDTLIIQVTNQNAYSLLHELEKLNLIKVLKKENNSSEKLSEKFAGNYLRMLPKNYKIILSKVVTNGICDR